MKITIVTPVFEDVRILRALESVWGQEGDFTLESIVVDGGSSSEEMAEALSTASEMGSVVVSEPDEGLYDAMNKGVGRASGDVVGILNADDHYADERVLADVADALRDSGAEAAYGDLVYHDRGEVIRTWKAGEGSRLKWWLGWMPPHPTFFVRRELYERFGTFNRAYSIAADYDLMFRFLYVHRSEVVYIPRELVRMATGGHSAPSPGTVTRANLEVLRSWMEHRRIPSPLAPVLKPLRKIVQFI